MWISLDHCGPLSIGEEISYRKKLSRASMAMHSGLYIYCLRSGGDVKLI